MNFYSSAAHPSVEMERLGDFFELAPPSDFDDALNDVIRERLKPLPMKSPEPFTEKDAEKAEYIIVPNNPGATNMIKVLTRVKSHFPGVIPEKLSLDYLSLVQIMRNLGLDPKDVFLWLAEQTQPENVCVLPFWVMLSFVYQRKNIEITQEFTDAYFMRFEHICKIARISFTECMDSFERNWHPIFYKGFFEAFYRQFIKYFLIPFDKEEVKIAHRENFMTALFLLGKFRRILNFGESNIHNIFVFLEDQNPAPQNPAPE